MLGNPHYVVDRKITLSKLADTDHFLLNSALYLRVLRAWARDNQAVNLTEAHVTGGNETVIRPSSSAADSGCKVTPSGSSAVLVR